MTKEEATALREAYCTMRDIIIDIPGCRFCPFNDAGRNCILDSCPRRWPDAKPNVVETYMFDFKKNQT